MRKSILMFVTLAAFVVVMSGQTQRRSTPPVIVKGVGERTPQTGGPKPPPPPPELSASAKAQLLKSLNLTGPGSLYVKLTPRDNYVASRGSLLFQDASIVDGSVNWVAWYAPASDAKSVKVLVKSEGAGRRYLFDCSVGSSMLDQDKGPFKLWRGQKIIQTFDVDETHIAFLLDAADAGWNTFLITGGPVWYFFSCEVTRL
ncbi:MAG TPA: hypothetical protein VGS96_18085 [Thermoanaerobaculia bacterium]|jgi:hypothetical protein|nr:hypothetical protein [Thermoanaerobaculia bacterium]